jgi:nucleotide-binding universal stress UspA family protein
VATSDCRFCEAGFVGPGVIRVTASLGESRYKRSRHGSHIALLAGAARLPATPHYRGENGRIIVTAQLTPTGVGIHHVLIATDFSSCSNQALDIGLKLAKAHQAEASVILVLPSNEFMLAGPDAYVAARDAACRDMANLKVELRSSQSYIEGSDYHLYLLEGEVAPRILSFAQEKQIDLIILGTHGRSGLGKALMGSVAERVFRGSPVPVMTIGPCAKHAVEVLTPRNVLAAVDFTPASEQAVRYAAAMTAERHAKLTLLHVLNPREMSHAPDRSQALREAERKLAALLADGQNPQAEALVKVGHLVPTILETERERNADLLVLGVRPSLATLSRFMWPNAHEIVRESSCPVLTVRGNHR